jgi:hypothetical protein
VSEVEPPSGAHSLVEGVAIDVDRDRLALALRRNTRFLATWGGIALADVVLIVVLALTDLGRTLTYTLLVVLLLALVPSIALGIFLRRRVRGFLRLPGPFLVVDRGGFVFAGMPAIGWSDMLGVIYGDTSADLARGGGFSRWAKRLVTGAGGSQIMISVGLDRPRRFQRESVGALRRYFSAGFDLGGLIIPIDHALGDDRLALLRSTLRAGTTHGNVPYLESTDAREIGRASYAFGTGKRMRTQD